MKTIGNKLQVATTRGTFAVQKIIPEGATTPKWGVWRNGTHIGSETTKARAVSVIEFWPNDIPSRRW